MNKAHRKPLEQSASLKAFSSPKSVTIAPEVLEQLNKANEQLEQEQNKNSQFDKIDLNALEKRETKSDKTKQLQSVVAINEQDYKEVDDDEFKELDDILFQHEKELVEKEKSKERSKYKKARKTVVFVAALLAFIVAVGYIAGYFLLPIYHQSTLNSLHEEYLNTSSPSDDY